MKMKKFNYYQTIARRNYQKWCRTHKEIYLDRAIKYNEIIDEMISTRKIC
jgi:hypothetical protein